MDRVHQIALGGGLFAVFTFIHFFVDWICQTHAEAMAKHNNAKVRARHCLIYTVGFIPLMYLLGFTPLKFVIGLNILFWSHFVEDTYFPVFLWAKYIRKPAEMTAPIVLQDNSGLIKAQVLPPDPKEGFIKFISTPLGKILMITVDQIIHLTFLIPLVWMALN
jgi:hypothetical protein